MKYLFATLIAIVPFSFLKAKINPANGSKINYTQVMFEYDKVAKASEYIIQVAADNGTESFAKPVIEQKDNSTATIINGLEFGSNYVWRYAGIVSGQQLPWKGPFKFGISIDTTIKLDRLKMRILKNDSLKNAKGLIILGCAKMIIDRNGKPVWYLPRLNKKILIKRTGIHDIRISEGGTVVFLSNNEKRSDVYECDLDGNILWKAPNDGKVSKDTSEYYNHDVRKLKNGNYMIIGAKYMSRTVPEGVDASKYNPENVSKVGNEQKLKVLFNTLIEYNKKKQVVWSWNSGDYLTDQDLFAPGSATNNPRRELPQRAEIFGHMNAFDVDTENKYVYGGFRDISRVIKIEKSSKKVVKSWGLLMPSGDAKEGNDFFKNQHDMNILPNGNIAVFDNNNMWNRKDPSRAIEFTQGSPDSKSQIVWSFNCKFDSLTNGKSFRFGGVDLLSNGNALICMGILNRMTEVTKDKGEIVWDGFYDFEGVDTAFRNSVPLFRVHNISSLYPCYFTVQKNDIDTDNSNELLIFNEGTDSDNYSISVTSDTGVKLNTIKSESLTPGTSTKINILPKGKPANTKSIVVTVTSNTNPDLIRKLNFN